MGGEGGRNPSKHTPLHVTNNPMQLPTNIKAVNLFSFSEIRSDVFFLSFTFILTNGCVMSRGYKLDCHICAFRPDASVFATAYV